MPKLRLTLVCGALLLCESCPRRGPAAQPVQAVSLQVSSPTANAQQPDASPPKALAGVNQKRIAKRDVSPLGITMPPDFKLRIESGAELAVWLVVAASSSSPAAISRKAKDLAAKGLHVFVFQSNDCGKEQNLFGAAVDVSESIGTAKVALDRVASTAKGAYIRRCDVMPRSLLAHGFPAVDVSIADVPSDALNWEDSDRISTVARLPDGRDIIESRVYVADPEDVLEGKRVHVILPSAFGKGRLLSDDCIWPEHFRSHAGMIAFQCAGEEAGDQLLHTVLAFDANGAPLAKVQNCRAPIQLEDAALTCKKESVSVEGRLKLSPRRHPFSKPTPGLSP